jgi:PRC-barrel domain protein
MDKVGGADPFAELKTSSEEYAVYDSHYERIGKVDDVFLDELDQVSYVGVKLGLLGTNSTLIPAELVRVNDKRRLIEVAEAKETVERAPQFGKDETVSPELEDRVRTYFGLEPRHSPRAQETPHPSEPSTRFGPDERVDLEPGERAREERLLHGPGSVEGVSSPGSAPGRNREGEQIERPSTESEGRWETQRTVGGVTVHRLRRT